MGYSLVTGGAKGLGAEMCRSLARCGHHILVHYRSSQEQAKRVAEECRSYGVKAEIICGDFSTMKGVKQLMNEIQQSYSEVENLINNVGNFLECSAKDTTVESWEELFQVNLHAPFALIKGLLPSIQSNRGHIINIGSVGVTNLKADTKYAAYSTSKMALYLLTKSLARELAPDHVKVNMISPGEMENSVTLNKFLSQLPMERPALMEEVARVVTFLLDKKSEYITGQNIEVSGGFAL